MKLRELLPSPLELLENLIFEADLRCIQKETRPPTQVVGEEILHLEMLNYLCQVVILQRVVLQDVYLG